MGLKPDPFKGTHWEDRPKDKKDLLTGVGGMVVHVPIEGIMPQVLGLTPPVPEEDVILPGVRKFLTSKPFKRSIEKAVKRREERVSRLETWADQVVDHLGNVSVSSRADGPIKIGLPCEAGHTVEWHSANRIPAEAIKSKLKRAGWELGRHILCPEHAHPRKQRVKKKGGGTMATEAQIAATDAARTAKRLAVMALEESFNTEKGCYKQGVSDDTIARELGVSKDVIARLREEFFGPLKVPADIDDIRQQIEQVRSEMVRKLTDVQTAAEEKIGKLERHLAALVNKNKWLDA